MYEIIPAGRLMTDPGDASALSGVSSEQNTLSRKIAAGLLTACFTLTGCSSPEPVQQETTGITQPGSPSPERAGESATQAPETTAAAPTPESARYPEHSVMATVFYLGEVPSADNAYISNTETAWDSDPVSRFGGVDNPLRRTADGLPAGFRPNHNPFYVALPADEFDDNGLIPGAREASPWAKEPASDEVSLFKGRWVAVTRGNRTVYAQWLDCGPSDDPNGARDYQYVFGPSGAQPKNQFGLKAGIDLSPAAAYNLGFGVNEGGAEVTWHFVDAKDVPQGLWSQFPPIDNATHWD